MRPRKPHNRSRSLSADDYAALTLIGSYYRRTRTEAGLSRLEVSETIGMHLSTVANFERGAQNVTLSVLIHLCDTVGVKPSVILARAGH
jgi:transcriptional regulator with XRE-family HTH domain